MHQFITQHPATAQGNKFEELFHLPPLSTSTMSMRRSPNIAIAGTPGTGKSTLCEKLRRRLSGFTVVDFGREAELRGCRESYDEELECWIIEEDEVGPSIPRCPQLCFLVYEGSSFSD